MTYRFDEAGTGVRDARRAGVAYKRDPLASEEPRDYLACFLHFSRGVKPLEWFRNGIPREQFRDDSRVLGVDTGALLERTQRAKRDVLQIPYRRRND